MNTNTKEKNQVLFDWITSVIKEALRNQASDGSMPSGHNGPYNDIETPVRNTSHWLISFAHAYEWTGEERFLNAAQKCADYLLLESSRPHRFSFHHRNGRKDNCNGLVGPAWTFEALAKATEVLEDAQYSHIAEEVFFQHHFNEHLGLWNRLEINGDILSIDSTFNHQLWFAACASLLKTKRENEIKQLLNHFLDCLPKNITLKKAGLIYHPIERKLNDKYATVSLIVRIKKIAIWGLKNLGVKKYNQNSIDKKGKLKGMIHKSIGYHHFNTYAFGILKKQLPNHSFWSSSIFYRLTNYLLTDEFKQGLENNKYGFPYNPPGFEIPYSLFSLKELNEAELIVISEYWLNKQMMSSYNSETLLMDRNTEDSKTHTARIYELTRLPKDLLDKIRIQNTND